LPNTEVGADEKRRFLCELRILIKGMQQEGKEKEKK